MVRLSVRGDVLFRSRLAGVFPHEGAEGGSLHEARQPGIERVHQLEYEAFPAVIEQLAEKL